MAERLDDETIAEIQVMCRQIYDTLPQPHSVTRLTVFFAVAAEASGLNKNQITQALGSGSV